MGDMSEHIEWANPVHEDYDEYREHIAGRCDKGCSYCAEDETDEMEYYGEENVK